MSRENTQKLGDTKMITYADGSLNYLTDNLLEVGGQVKVGYDSTNKPIYKTVKEIVSKRKAKGFINMFQNRIFLN